MATASARYARALFEEAQESGETEAWTGRLDSLRAFLDDPEVRQVLANPSIAVERRLEAVQALAPSNLGQQVLNLARLLVEANRVDGVAAIAKNFERLADAAAGRVRATATTAVEVSEEERDELARGLSAQLGGEVRLTLEVDPSIVGGLIVQVGDHLVDASLKTRLQQLRRRLAPV